MRRGGGRIAVVGASLALLVAAPLAAVHVAGAGRALAPGAGVALLVVDPVEARAMLPDGTGATAVPWLQPGDADLAVAPSGRRLAFTSARSGNRELYVADLATGAVRRLTWSSGSDDVEPAWSPDGSQVVWASGTEGDHDLFRSRIDRPRAVRLTRGAADDREPAWAPSGSRIAFASDVQGAFDLWVVAAAGGQPELVHDAVGEARSPDWHPAGDRLAFTGLAGGAADVWVAGLDGSSRRLTTSSGYDGRPDWAPDGRSLAFLRGRGGTLQPWVVRAAGGGATRVERLPRGAREVTWARLAPELAPARTARLPDLDQRSPSDLVVRAGGGRFRLGFTSATDNVGDGALWLLGERRSTAAPMLVEQRVLHEGGATSTLEGVGLLRYELRTVDGRLVVSDRKTGFCLIDRWGLARGMRGRPRALPRFVGDCATLQPKALRVEEGSSVGYTDRYPAFFHGQDLDLTGVRPGLYVLVQHANPERRLRELDYANNASSALLRVTRPAGRSKAPVVAVLRRCAGSQSCYPPGAK